MVAIGHKSFSRSAGLESPTWEIEPAAARRKASSGMQTHRQLSVDRQPGDAAGKWDFDMFSAICNLIYTWNLENSEECGHTCAVVHAGPIFDKDAELRNFQPDSDENICLLAK